MRRPCEGGSDGGTIYKVATALTETVLYNFSDSGNEQNPEAGLVLGSDGNFYGVTVHGGDNDNGTVYRITPAGAFTTL